MTAEELSKEFSHFINRADTSDIKTLVLGITNNHRTLQQCTFGLFMALIQEWKRLYESGYYDARNEFTCQKSKEIVENIEYMDLRPPLI